MTQDVGSARLDEGIGEAAEELYADFLAQQERGESVSFDDLCRMHPRLEFSLRLVHKEMLCVAAADEKLHFIPRATSSDNGTPHDLPGDIGVQDGLLEGDGRDAAHEILERLADEAPGSWPFDDPEELGRGGFGIVYSINEGALRRKVALKTLRNWPKGEFLNPRERAQHNRRLVRFLAEAQILAQLDHPSIVPLYGVGVDSSRKPYFTMRLVRGRDLTQVVKLIHERREGWDVNRGLEVLLKVCDAVSYAHSKHVLHRDLKSDNIRVGRFGEVYVMDWGLARVVGARRSQSSLSEPSDFSESVRTFKESLENPESNDGRLTVDGAIVGSPAYMSPEQARGEHDLVDSRSDIFSIGAILYHVFAGYAPYSRPDRKSGPKQIVMQVVAGPPTPLHEIQPDLAPELEAICAKAMARDPDARYQTVGRLATDLRAFLDGRVVSAYGSGRTLELRKWVARNRALAWTTIVSLVVIVLGLSLSALQLSAKNTKISESEARLRSSYRFFDSTFLDTSLFDIDATRDRKLNRGAWTTVVDAMRNARQDGLDVDLEDTLRAKMAIAVGTGRMGRGELNGARTEFEQALRFLGELEPPDPHQELRAELGLLWVDAWDRRFSAGRERGVRVLRMAGAQSVERVSALMALSIVEHNAGRLEEGERLIEEALALAGEINRLAQEADVSGDGEGEDLIRPRVNVGVLEAQHANLLTRLGAARGEPDLIEQAKEIATSVASHEGRFEAALARMMLARIALQRGELLDAKIQADDALEVLRDLSGDSSIHTLNFRAVQADIRIAMGRELGGEEGARLIEEGLEDHRWIARRARVQLNFSHFSGAIRSQGRLATALARIGDPAYRAETREAFDSWYALVKEGEPEFGVGHLRTLEAWVDFLTQPEASPEDLALAESTIVRARNIAIGLLLQEQEAPPGEKPLFAWHPGRVVLMELKLARRNGDAERSRRLDMLLAKTLEERPDPILERDRRRLLGSEGRAEDE